MESCLTLCDFMDCSPIGSSVHGKRTSSQEDWSGLPFLFPGDLPNPGIEPKFPALVGLFTTELPEEDVQQVLSK